RSKRDWSSDVCSSDLFRGIGIDEGLRILSDARSATGLPVLTDVHEPSQVGPTAEVVDVLQIPALLCRQTDLVQAAAASGKPVNRSEERRVGEGRGERR